MPVINPPYTPPTTSVADRAPLASDDSTKYPTTAVWAARGPKSKLLYTVADMSTAGAAVWTPSISPTYAKAADVLGAACVAAGGLMCMKAGYTGGAIDLQTTVASTPTTTTINILAGGALDVATLEKTMAAADAGSKFYVTKVYDQTANANHFVQFGAIGYPQIMWDGVLESYVITGAQLPANTPGCLQNATLALNPTNFGAFFFGRAAGCGNNSSNVIASFGTYTGATSLAYILQSGADGKLLAFSSNATSTSASNATATIPPTMDSSPCVISVIGNAANSGSVTVNEDVGILSGETRKPTSTTGVILGYDNISTGRYMGMRLVGFAIANAAPTTAQQAAIRQGAYYDLPIIPQANDVVVCIGDSRFSGYLTTLNQGAPDLLRKSINRPVRWYNFGHGGQTAQNMISTSVVNAAAQYRAGYRNIAIVLAGVNDFIVNAATAATTLGYLQSIYTTLRAAGFTVVTVAELSANAPNGAFLASLRTLILANARTVGDYVIDVSTYAPVTTPGTAAFYSDGLHPTTPLSQLIAGALYPTVINLLGGVP